ncbi:uncharacterized protein LOC143842731 [Paroedura picta]|uniref:uncharacterized protein LOC143842731 n=1 Tax=Paroedura picta TaxID=143630 RepID=UPI004055BBD9
MGVPSWPCWIPCPSYFPQHRCCAMSIGEGVRRQCSSQLLCKRTCEHQRRLSTPIAEVWGRLAICSFWTGKKALDTVLIKSQDELDEFFMEEEEDLHTWVNTRLCFLEPPEETILSEELEGPFSGWHPSGFKWQRHLK